MGSQSNKPLFSFIRPTLRILARSVHWHPLRPSPRRSARRHPMQATTAFKMVYHLTFFSERLHLPYKVRFHDPVSGNAAILVLPRFGSVQRSEPPNRRTEPFRTEPWSRFGTEGKFEPNRGRTATFSYRNDGSNH